MDLYDELVGILEHLDEQGIDYAICGGTGLAKMKRLAGRDQDLLDLKMLGFLDDG